MYSPASSGIPSESTIEQLSNHHLLMAISPFGGWFYIPTKPAEKACGFDASLQYSKLLVLQYKRVGPGPKGSSKVKIDLEQLKTLTNNFPKASRPYVFYAFSPLPSYAALSSLFATGSGACFGANMCFVNLHDIPAKTTALIACGPSGPVMANTLIVNHLNLNAVAKGFSECSIGLPSAEFLTWTVPDSDGSGRRARFRNLSVLQAQFSARPE